MESNLWPWFAVAAAGALHGSNPVAGWALAAWPAGDGPLRPGRRLAAIAAGHLLSVLAVAAAVPVGLALGLGFDPLLLQGLAAVLLALAVLRHFSHRGTRARAPGSGSAALALWSFIVGIGHGAGWMLMPALASLCGSGMPGREIAASGSLGLALAAVGLHMAAMLATTAALAAGARRAFRLLCKRDTMANDNSAHAPPADHRRARGLAGRGPAGG